MDAKVVTHEDRVGGVVDGDVVDDPVHIGRGKLFDGDVFVRIGYCQHGRAFVDGTGAALRWGGSNHQGRKLGNREGLVEGKFDDGVCWFISTVALLK